ncbi:MAG TPA: TPM domain-containing protein, partial [Pyrinomonadaceae bacterium]|nr:TPM domain-containing protein [Pyrinomonadaceae bacterium]
MSFSIRSQETGKPFSINESPLQAPTSPVMDYAGVLDAATKQALEQRIIAFRDTTNPKVELAVAIVATTGERPIFDYSLAVARGWKIGSKQDDNPSALLFVAVNDRKYFTHVSKDLEDELPDGLVGQLQRQYLVPAFRQQNYGKGVSDTIEAYIRTIE